MFAPCRAHSHAFKRVPEIFAFNFRNAVKSEPGGKCIKGVTYHTFLSFFYCENTPWVSFVKKKPADCASFKTHFFSAFLLIPLRTTNTKYKTMAETHAMFI